MGVGRDRHGARRRTAGAPDVREALSARIESARAPRRCSGCGRSPAPRSWPPCSRSPSAPCCSRSCCGSRTRGWSALATGAAIAPGGSWFPCLAPDSGARWPVGPGPVPRPAQLVCGRGRLVGPGHRPDPRLRQRCAAGMLLAGVGVGLTLPTCWRPPPPRYSAIVSTGSAAVNMLARWGWRSGRRLVAVLGSTTRAGRASARVRARMVVHRRAQPGQRARRGPRAAGPSLAPTSAPPALPLARPRSPSKRLAPRGGECRTPPCETEPRSRRSASCRG